MVSVQLIQRDGAACRQLRIGHAVHIALQHQTGQVRGNHGAQLHDVAAGCHPDHAVVVVAVVLADHREVRQLDRAVLRVHGEQHVTNHGIRLDDDVAVADLDVGIRGQLLAADQIPEENVSASDDVQRLLRRSDGAGRAGHQRHVLLRGDVRSRLPVRSAIQQASILIGHGDDHLTARERSQRIAHSGNLRELLRIGARAVQDDAAVGAHADAVGQRVVQHAVDGLHGQPRFAAIVDPRLASAGGNGCPQPVRAIKVPVTALHIPGDHVGQAFQRHVLLLQVELRLNRRAFAAVLIDQRIRVHDLHEAGFIRPAIKDRSEFADAVGIRVHQHQHPAVCGDVQVIVDAVALTGDVLVLRQRGLFDRNVADRAVDLRIAVPAVRLVESNVIVGIRVVRISRLDHQRRRARTCIDDAHTVIVERNRLEAQGIVIVALVVIAADDDAILVLGGHGARLGIAVGEVHILVNGDCDGSFIGGYVRHRRAGLHIANAVVRIDRQSIQTPACAIIRHLCAEPGAVLNLVVARQSGDAEEVVDRDISELRGFNTLPQHRCSKEGAHGVVHPSVVRIILVAFEPLDNVRIDIDGAEIVLIPEFIQLVAHVAGLLLRVVLAADDVRLHGVVRHHQQIGLGIRVRIERIGRDLAIRHPVVAGTVFRLPLRQARGRQLRLPTGILLSVLHLIGIGELKLTGAGADVAHQPARVDDGQQRFKRRALVERQLAGGQIQRHAVAQPDGNHPVARIGEAVLVERCCDLDAVHRLRDAHNLPVRRDIHLRAVGQQMDVQAVHRAIAPEIVIETRRIKGGVREHFLHHTGDILQRARKRHGHHNGILQAVQANALAEQQVVDLPCKQGFDPHRRLKRLAAAVRRQGIDLLKQHRRQKHIAVPGRLRVHHALRTVKLEHECPEAMLRILTDAPGVLDAQRVRPHGRSLGARRADHGDVVRRRQLSAGFARPAERRVAVPVGNQTAHVHIARAPCFHTDGGRGHAAVCAVIAVRAADLGVDEVDVLHGDAHQRKLPVGAVGDRHLGNEPLIVDRVAAAGVLTERKRAGQRIGKRHDGDLQSVIEDQHHVFLRQAHLTDAAARNINSDTDRRVADVEARAGMNAHGGGGIKRAVAVRAAGSDAGSAGVRVLVDCAAKPDRVELHVRAVDVNARADDRPGGAGAVCAAVAALFVQPGLRIRATDALRERIGVVVDIRSAIRRRRIRLNPHVIIALDRRVGDVHGIGEGCQRTAARLDVDAQAASTGIGLHVEVQLAEVAVDVHVPADDFSLARAALSDVHRGRQLERAQCARVRLVAHARVVHPGIAVHVVGGRVGDHRHVAEGVLQQRAPGDAHARIRAHVGIGPCIADRHKGGVIHARFGVHIVAFAADRLHIEAAKVCFEACAAADVDLDRAVQRIVGLHLAIRDEATLRGAPRKRVHPRV